MTDETYDPSKDKDRAKKIQMGQDAPKAEKPKTAEPKAQTIAEVDAEMAEKAKKEETDGEEA